MTTTTHADSDEARGTTRWGLSFAVVLAAHAAAVLLLSRHPDTLVLPLEPPAVLLDLEPRPEPVVEPGPEPPSPISEPVTDTPEPPPVERPQPEAVQVPPEPEPPPPPTLELPPSPRPLPPPPRLPRPKPVPIVTQPTPLPRAAPAPATPTQAVSREAVAAATTSWQGRLQAHLARFKRYPPQAQMSRQEGTPLLRFTMTRDGRVLSFDLARGSGHEALDREALDLMQRAQPLPALPPEVPRATIDLVVPLRFQLR